MHNAFRNINDALDAYDRSIHISSIPNLNQSINPICAYVLLRLLLSHKYEKDGGILFFGTRTNNYCNALIQLHLIKHKAGTLYDDRNGDYQITPLGEKYVESQFPHYLLIAWILLLTKTFKNLLGFAFVFLMIIGWSWNINKLLSIPLSSDSISYLISLIIMSIILFSGIELLVVPVTYSIKYHHGLKNVTKLNFIRFICNSQFPSLTNLDNHTIHIMSHSMFPSKRHVPLIERIRQRYHDHW